MAVERVSAIPTRSLARAVALLALFVVPALASAQVRIDDAWVRGTVTGQRATGAFMRIVTPSNVALVGASSPLAGTVELHTTIIDKGVAKMRAVPHVPIAPNEPLELKPGGLHVMLRALKQPMNAGDRVPITLVFVDGNGKRSSVEVVATVRPLGADGAKHGH